MFTSKKVIVPSAGESTIYFLEGFAVVVGEMPSPSSLETAPKLSFDDRSNNPQPLTPQSVYGFKKGFDRISIVGTEESAGDEITLLATDYCLPDEINVNLAGSRKAIFKDTFSVVTSDSVQTFSELQLANDDLGMPNAMYITANGGDVHYCKGSDPEQGANALGHILNDGETQKIEGVEWITDFNFISGTASTPVELSVTLEY